MIDFHPVPDVINPIVLCVLGDFEMSDKFKDPVSEPSTGNLSDDQLSINIEGTGDRSLLRTVTLHWADSELSPIFFSNCWITFWEDGAWAEGSTIEDRSSHSDWDVWIDLYLQNTNGNETARLGNQVWFQDIDVGEKYTKSSTGFSAAVRDGFRFLEGGYWVAGRTRHIIRDNRLQNNQYEYYLSFEDACLQRNPIVWESGESITIVDYSNCNNGQKVERFVSGTQTDDTGPVLTFAYRRLKSNQV